MQGRVWPCGGRWTVGRPRDPAPDVLFTLPAPETRAAIPGVKDGRNDPYRHAYEGDCASPLPALIPTVSPLTIPLVYCHINSFQRASGVERPLPGGEKRRGGRAWHHKEW